ncbi:MAG: phosphoribosylglycinamide formyltransferase [Chitinophagales bacterium]
MNSASDKLMKEKKNVAILASGTGSNAENLIQYFDGHPSIRIALIVTNNKDAGVIKIAEKYNIPYRIFLKQEWWDTFNIIYVFEGFKIDLIVLAGYLSLIPTEFIEAFKNRIINIHPALLPKYGGKGMFGNHVHRTVLYNKEKETGITIHEVDEIYDNGKILLQEKIPIAPDDDARSIEKKVRQLEYKYLPLVVEKLLLKNE